MILQRSKHSVDCFRQKCRAFASLCLLHFFRFFFFNDTATTEIYTLSLHDALPISSTPATRPCGRALRRFRWCRRDRGDRKSTRLNSSHSSISYAVFCLQKKKNRCIILLGEQEISLYMVKETKIAI